MTSITLNIPNHNNPISAKERELADIDHALGQLRQMKEGKLKGIDAEELLNG
jgi:hypothetical protein